MNTEFVKYLFRSGGNIEDLSLLLNYAHGLNSSNSQNDEDPISHNDYFILLDKLDSLIFGKSNYTEFDWLLLKTIYILMHYVF